MLGTGFAVAVLLGLSGCGKSAQSQFTDSFFKEASDHSKSTISMQIKDMQLTDSSSSSNSEVKSMLGKGKLNLTMIMNRPKNQVALSGDYDKIAGGVIVTNKKVYVSGDLIASVTKAESKLSTSGATFDQDAIDQLKGKYMAEDLDTKDLKVSTKDTKETLAFQKAVTKAMKDDYNKFDKDSFKKKGDVITHKLTVKELTTLLNSYNTVAKSKKAYKDNKLSKSDIKEAKDWLKHYSVTMSDDTKTDHQTVQIKGGDKADGVKNLNVIVKTKTTATKQNVKVPSKSDVVTEKAVQKALTPKMSNSSFQSIFKSYKQLPKASRKQYLDTMKDTKEYFTDEQWKQMSDLAK